MQSSNCLEQVTTDEGQMIFHELFEVITDDFYNTVENSRHIG